MYRLSVKSSRIIAQHSSIVPRDLFVNQARYLPTTPVGDVLFPTKSDFPSRHIGPRKTDVVSMLDTLGYKVNIPKIQL